MALLFELGFVAFVILVVISFIELFIILLFIFLMDVKKKLDVKG